MVDLLNTTLPDERVTFIEETSDTPNEEFRIYYDNPRCATKFVDGSNDYVRERPASETTSELTAIEELKRYLISLDINQYLLFYYLAFKFKVSLPIFMYICQ